MKTIKIKKEDIKILNCILNSYPLMEETDKEAIKFNEDLTRLTLRIQEQL